jgi:transcriptional regulator
MTVYNPPFFREDDRATLHAMICNARLAILASNGADGLPEISYLPFVFEEPAPGTDGDRTGGEGPGGQATGGERTVLVGHFARANPHWKSLSAPGSRATVIFKGADAYVSPSFYPTKPVHHRHVPTWNYEAVHAVCRVEIFDDAARLRDVVLRLTTRFEAGRDQPWTIDQAPPDYIAAMLRAIVGIRLMIEELTGKRKLSQNRDAVDRQGTRAALETSSDQSERDIARAMRDLEERKLERANLEQRKREQRTP